jgi:hypothetical protein
LTGLPEKVAQITVNCWGIEPGLVQTVGIPARITCPYSDKPEETHFRNGC